MLKCRSVIFFPAGRSPVGKKMTLWLFGIVPLKCGAQSNSSFYIYFSYLLITSPDFSLSSLIPLFPLISLLPHPLLTAHGCPRHQWVHYTHLCHRCPSLLLWLHPSMIDSLGSYGVHAFSNPQPPLEVGDCRWSTVCWKCKHVHACHNYAIVLPFA